MNSLGTFPHKAEMKDHAPLNDVHFFEQRCFQRTAFWAIVGHCFPRFGNHRETSEGPQRSLPHFLVISGCGQGWGGNAYKPPYPKAIEGKDGDNSREIVETFLTQMGNGYLSELL
jgi:hypothetical protein